MQRDAVKPLLHHPNDVCPTIKFTIEPEKDGSLPFHDTKLTRRGDGTLKKADTHGQVLALQLLPSSISAKRAAVRSLFDTARNITLQKEDLRKEEHLTTTFKQNSYPLPFFRATVSSSLQRLTTSAEEELDEEEDSQEEKQPLAVIPYVSGVSERIRKACTCEISST